MNAKSIAGFCTAVVLLFAAGLLLRAQSPSAAAPSSAPVDAPRDLNGVWNTQTPTFGLRPVKVAPMTPEAQMKFDANTAELKRGLPISVDPVYKCEPAGIPHAYQNGAYPFELFQTPKRIFMFFESQHDWREIWMDGRPLPKDPDPAWSGYSVGHWDGNDLVIESTGFDARTWLDGAGHPHSDALRLVERLHRPSHDLLELEVTITDPKSYTEPWVLKEEFHLKPTWEIGQAYCVMSEQESFNEHILKKNAEPAPAASAK